MPRGDKSSYTPRQKRRAEHIEQSYKARGLDPEEAQARGWASVNKQSGGGERSGRGRTTPAAARPSARKDSARGALAKHGHSLNRGHLSARRSRHAPA